MRLTTLRQHLYHSTQLVLLTLFLSTSNSFAASPDFQDFLFGACTTADPNSDFNTRCNIDSVGGDLSGDSEDSLVPTQSLANGTNALAETRSRIKALRAKMQEERGEPGETEDSASSTDIKTTFGTSGISLLFNATDGNLERLKTDLERGYETTSTKIQLGLDYRINDDWMLGALLGWDRYDTRYDGAAPGRNFIPGDSEGSSNADNFNFSVFTTVVITDNVYVDALASYSSSNYTFRRIGLFQESTRSTPTIDVITAANTDGNQLALSIGTGWDKSYGANLIQIYGRLGRFSSSVDPYSETGGAGFAMSIENKDSSETIATAGFKFSRSINTSFGVLVPQIYAEYENALDSEVSRSLSSFVADASGTRFETLGDTPDETSARLGVAILGSFPDGWTGFISVNKLSGNDYREELRITAGIRVEL